MEALKRIRLAGAGLGLTTAMLLGGACSGEALAEFGLEKVLAAETGEDIAIDIDGNTFRVEGPDGEFVFDAEGFADGTGTFSVQGDGESFTGTFDESSFVMQGADGPVMEATYDDDSFEVTSADGSFTMTGSTDSADGSETVTFTDSDGTTTTYGFDQTRPGDWPRYIGEPATMIAEDTIYSTSDGSSHALFSYTPGEAYLETLVTALAAQGFETVQDMSFEGTITQVLVNPSTNTGVHILGSDAEGFASVTVGPADQF